MNAFSVICSREIPRVAMIVAVSLFVVLGMDVSDVHAQAVLREPRAGGSAEHSSDDWPRPLSSNALGGSGVQPANFTSSDAGSSPAANLAPPKLSMPLALDTQQLTSPRGLTNTLKIMLLLTILSLAPAILMMTTCFIRFVVVLGLLRQALGTQQLPPNQVLTSLAMFLTFMVMAPVYQQAWEEGLRPYTQPRAGEAAMDEATAIRKTLAPVRRFMTEQIDRAGNGDALWMFIDYQRPPSGSKAAENWREPETYEDVPLLALLPAYTLSELKVSFLIGFQIYLPFLVIDMVVSSVLISMGMMMLPPVLVSLPFKLLTFVMIDGWFLTVGMLLESVRPGG